jgi:hypothetical protein
MIDCTRSVAVLLLVSSPECVAGGFFTVNKTKLCEVVRSSVSLTVNHSFIHQKEEKHQNPPKEEEWNHRKLPSSNWVS